MFSASQKKTAKPAVSIILLTGKNQKNSVKFYFYLELRTFRKSDTVSKVAARPEKKKT